MRASRCWFFAALAALCTAAVGAGQEAPKWKFDKDFTQTWTVTAAGKVTVTGATPTSKDFDNQVVLTLTWQKGKEGKVDEATKKSVVTIPVTIDALSVKVKVGAASFDSAKSPNEKLSKALAAVTKKSFTVKLEKDDKGALKLLDVEGLAKLSDGLDADQKKLIASVLSDKLIKRQLALLSFPVVPSGAAEPVAQPAIDVPGLGSFALKTTVTPVENMAGKFTLKAEPTFAPASPLPEEGVRITTATLAAGTGEMTFDPALGQVKSLTLTFDSSDAPQKVTLSVAGGTTTVVEVAQKYTLKIETVEKKMP